MDSETTTDSANCKKANDVVIKTTAAIRMRIKKQMQKCFFTASDCKGSRWIDESSRSLRELYYYASKFSDGVRYFMFCFRFIVERLWERNISKLLWNNCMKMATNVSLVLSLKGDTKLIDFLVGLCEQVSQLSVVRLRTYSCNLVELIFLMEKRVDEYAVILNGEQRSSLSSENKLTLYDVVMEREFDSNSTVRVAALRAIAAIQGNDILEALNQKHLKLPEKILQAHLQDVSYECRLAVVHLLSINDENSVELMLDVAMSDENQSVRKSSLTRLAKEVQVEKMGLKTRMLLLRELFLNNADSPNYSLLRQMLNRLMFNISNKVTKEKCKEVGNQCKIVVPELLELLDFHNEEELSLSTIVLSLACCRENLKMNELDCHYFMKQILYTGDRWVLNSHNYKQLLDRKMLSSNLAAMSFLLRCNASYCKLQCRTDADLFECYYKLLPTMLTFVNFIKKFVDYIFLKEVSESDSENNYFALIQLLKIVPLYNQDDVSGRQAWRTLLQTLLLNYKIHLSYSVISVIVKQMYQHFWPLKSDLEEALQFICDTTSSIVHHSYNPHATMLMANETISLNAIHADSTTIKIEETALLRCMMIINAMAKTNRYKQMCTLLLGLLDNVVEKGLIAENAECRSLAFEAMGIMTMYDEQCARQKTIFIRDTLELVDNLKVAALNIFCNYGLIFGFASVAEWYHGNGNFGDPDGDLLQVFRAGIWSEETDFSYAACRSLCQLILSKNLKSNEEIICDLLLKAFNYETENHQLVKSCLDCFLDCYSSECRDNQLLLVSCFKRIFDNISANAESFKVSNFDMPKFANSILSATSAQKLTVVEAEKPPVHAIFCKVVLEMLHLGCNYDNGLLCEVLCKLEIKRWKDIKFMEEVQSKLEDLMADFDDNGKVARSLRLFFRNIEDRLKELDSSKVQTKTTVYNDSDEDSDVMELINETSRFGLRTPLTRSATKKLVQNAEPLTVDMISSSGVFEGTNSGSSMEIERISPNVCCRRSRRCLSSIFEKNTSTAASSLPPLKEVEYEGSVKAMCELKADDLVEEMTERIAKIDCGTSLESHSNAVGKTDMKEN